jgi:hypothetical protein
MKTRFPITRTERFSRSEYRKVTDSYKGMDEREIKKIMNNTSQSGWGLVIAILLLIFAIATIAIMIHGG